MKKIMSLLLVLLLSVTFVGCTKTESTSQIDELTAKIADLESKIAINETNSNDFQTEIDDLKAKLAQLETESTSKQTEIENLKSKIKVLEDNLFDGSITIVIEHEDGLNQTKEIRFIESKEKSVFDLLNENCDLTFEDSTYGKYLTSIGDLSPKYGAYIAIDKNDSYATEGLEKIAYTDGDVFTFKIDWFDLVEKAVNTAIQNFISNYANDYVNEDDFDYLVGSSLNHLNVIDQFVNTQDVVSKYEGYTSTNGKELFKAIITVTAAGGNPTDVNGTDLLEQLIQNEPIGPWALTSYSSIALNAYNHSKDVTSYRTKIIDDLTMVNTPKDAGADMGGMTLIALSDYKDETNVQTVIEEYTNYISSENQLASGGVTDSYSGENSATIAQVILGLVANNINPRDKEFTKENGDLITRLLEFELGDGSFKWKPTDENADKGFSTPQAFAALVAYQQYKNTNNSFNIYDFKG